VLQKDKMASGFGPPSRNYYGTIAVQKVIVQAGQSPMPFLSLLFLHHLGIKCKKKIGNKT